MLPLALSLVVSSGFIHAIWNMLTKQSINKIVFLWCINIFSLLFFLPFFMMEVHHFINFSIVEWLIIVGAGASHGFYFLCMAKAYTVGDLSQVYPIMRGMASLFIPILGVLIFQESMSIFGWLGLAGMMIGIFFLGNWIGNYQRMNKRAMIYALLVSLCITSYVLIDKSALSYISPLALTAVHCIGLLCCLSWSTFRSKQIKKEWQSNKRTILWGSILVPGGYLLFLYAMTLAQLAQLAPIRDISIVFGTLFGIIILKEKQGYKRIGSSVLILIGIFVISMWG